MHVEAMRYDGGFVQVQKSKICSSGKQIDVKRIEFDDDLATEATLKDLETKCL